jgi:uncharacterized membrane protein YgcG
VDIQVLEGARELREACSEQPATFCVTDTDDGRSIRYFFTQPITDGTGEFTLVYTVIGALRVYADGDQLWWTVVPPDHPFPITRASITVHLPSDYAPREGVDRISVYDAAGEINVSGSIITATTTGILDVNQAFSLRIQYPHDSDAREAAWQDSYDTSTVRDEPETTVNSALNVGSLAVSLVIGVGGSLLAFVMWFTRGRAPKAPFVPAHLTEPPSNLPPAIAGLVVDGKAQFRHVLAMLIDLARRGYVVIEESAPETFNLRATGKPTSTLRDFEQIFLESVFERMTVRELDSLSNRFYDKLPVIYGLLDHLMVKHKLRQPNSKVGKFLGIGIGVGLIAVGVADLFLVPNNLPAWTDPVVYALIVVGIVLVVVTLLWSDMTQSGVAQRAKWKAFKEYLTRLEKYGSVNAAVQHFDDYLPFAIALGVDKVWISRFNGKHNLPALEWYLPLYVSSGDTDNSIEALDAPEVSLDGMSRGLSGSLNAMSMSLTSMLNSAAAVMTSQPASTSGSGSSSDWSSGGSDWSGGGDSGGGDSGGGSSSYD